MKNLDLYYNRLIIFIIGFPLTFVVIFITGVFLTIVAFAKNTNSASTNIQNLEIISENRN